MESTLLLDVVVREGAAILELFAREDKALLVWWDTGVENENRSVCDRNS